MQQSQYNSDEPFDPLDPHRLIETSRSRPAFGGRLLILFGSGFLGLLLLGLVAESLPPAVATVAPTLVMLGVLAVSMTMAWHASAAVRAQQAQLNAAEHAVHHRQWSRAAELLTNLLAGPVRVPPTRLSALAQLSAVLSRYDRFDDAVAVHDELLDTGQLDPGTLYQLRVARAVALLRSDRLVDADRAIGELRRQVSAVQEAADEITKQIDGPDATPPRFDAAELTLVEMYRDAITGHPDEVIEAYEAKLPALRRHLGHRVADCHLLAAIAYDQRDRPDDAQQAWTCATLLAPWKELIRRYPVAAPLVQKLTRAEPPAQMRAEPAPPMPSPMPPPTPTSPDADNADNADNAQENPA